MSAILTAVLAVHIGGGVIGVLSGFVAAGARKGALVHKIAGTWFFASMLVLGVTASILEPFRTPQPGSPLVGVLLCYFILTSWVTARRRDRTAGWFEIAACIAAFALAAATMWGGMTGDSTTPVGQGPVFALAGLCLLAGLLDLNAILRGRLTPAQRIARHLWRMCFAFFIATGSFFLGQQDVFPAPVRASPILLVLAFTPFAVMAVWLVRLRFAKAFSRLSFGAVTPAAPAS